MRERLLAWMITDLGVGALAIESSMTEVAQLDRYIQGEGDPDRAAQLVQRNATWPWRVVAFAHTLEWLRAYNAGRDPSQRVHIYGFDIQQPWVTLEYLRSELITPEWVELALRSADIQRIAVTPAVYQQYDEAERDQTRAALVELQADLHRTPELTDPLLVRTFGTLLQVEGHYRGYAAAGHQGVSPSREQTMADNIQWIAQTLSPHAPLVVWAHNGHVSRQPIHQSHADAMGRHLAASFGAGFVNVGVLFGQGAFLAMDRNQDRAIREFRVSLGPSGGLGPRLATAGLPRFVLDLRALSGDEPLREWLTEPREAWTVGSVVGDPNKQVGALDLIGSFDLIVFIQDVTAAVLVSEQTPPRAK